MESTKIDSFNKIAEITFHPLLEEYGYLLKEILTKEVKGFKCSSTHIYINTRSGLKVELIQAPFYTDYGFTFFLYKLGTDKYNILYNVPHEKQDNEGHFIKRACAELFNNPDIISLLSGKSWKNLKSIPFQY